MSNKLVYAFDKSYFYNQQANDAFDNIHCGYLYVLELWYSVGSTREYTFTILNKQKHSDYSFSLFCQEEINGVKYVGYYWIVPKTHMSIKPVITKITEL